MPGDRRGNDRGSRQFDIVVASVGDRVSYNGDCWEIVVAMVVMVVVVVLVVVAVVVVVVAKAWAKTKTHSRFGSIHRSEQRL